MMITMHYQPVEWQKTILSSNLCGDGSQMFLDVLNDFNVDNSWREGESSLEYEVCVEDMMVMAKHIESGVITNGQAIDLQRLYEKAKITEEEFVGMLKAVAGDADKKGTLWVRFSWI